MINLDTEQLEQLREIGSYLSQVRQDQSKTLEEISTKTFIPIRLLKAIEAAQEKTLPEPVFIQGFIRRYGDALGLNGKEISQRFNVNPMPTPTIELTPEPAVSEPLRPAFAVNSLRLPNPANRAANGSPSNGTSSGSNGSGSNGTNSGNSDRRRPSADSFDDRSNTPAKPPYALILGAAAIALAGLFFGVIRPGLEQQATSDSNRSTRSAQQQESTSSSSAPISQRPPSSNSTQANSTQANSTQANSTQANSTQANSTQANSTQASPSPSSSSTAPIIAGSVTPSTTSSSNPATNPASTPKAPVVVTVNLTGESWVEIIIDGKRQFEGILQKGFKKTWSAKQNFTISSGNAGAVNVSYNNGTAKPLGQLGAIETKSFTPASNTNSSPNP